MDRHETFAFSAAATAPGEEAIRELNDRDREALHRMFNDIRRAITGVSHHGVAAFPHP